VRQRSVATATWITWRTLSPRLSLKRHGQLASRCFFQESTDMCVFFEDFESNCLDLHFLRSELCMQGPILLHQPRREPWPLLQETDSNSAQYLNLYVLRAHDLHLIFWCSRQICWKRHPLPRWSGRGSKFADRLVAGGYNFFTPKLSRKPQSRPADNNNHEWWLLFSKFGFKSFQAKACFGCSESLLLFVLCHWDWWELWYQLINSLILSNTLTTV